MQGEKSHNSPQRSLTRTWTYRMSLELKTRLKQRKGQTQNWLCQKPQTHRASPELHPAPGDDFLPVQSSNQMALTPQESIAGVTKVAPPLSLGSLCAQQARDLTEPAVWRLKPLVGSQQMFQCQNDQRINNILKTIM